MSCNSDLNTAGRNPVLSLTVGTRVGDTVGLVDGASVGLALGSGGNNMPAKRKIKKLSENLLLDTLHKIVRQELRTWDLDGCK